MRHTVLHSQLLFLLDSEDYPYMLQLGYHTQKKFCSNILNHSIFFLLDHSEHTIHYVCTHSAHLLAKTKCPVRKAEKIQPTTIDNLHLGIVILFECIHARYQSCRCPW